MDKAAPRVAQMALNEAKTKLSALLDRVERGEEVIITRHGMKVARLVPEGTRDARAARAAVAGLTAIREAVAATVRIGPAEIRAIRAEGRR